MEYEGDVLNDPNDNVSGGTKPTRELMFRVYKRRWFVLLVLCLLNSSNAAVSKHFTNMAINQNKEGSVMLDNNLTNRAYTNIGNVSIFFVCRPILYYTIDDHSLFVHDLKSGIINYPCIKSAYADKISCNTILHDTIQEAY